MTDSTNAKLRELRERVADAQKITPEQFNWHKARLAILSALADAETNLSRLAAMIQEAGDAKENKDD